jgi:Protein of unknown function (DUF433)
LIDPKIGSGRPVLVGNAIRTATIADRFNAGESVSELATKAARRLISSTSSIVISDRRPVGSYGGTNSMCAFTMKTFSEKSTQDSVADDIWIRHCGNNGGGASVSSSILVLAFGLEHTSHRLVIHL